MYRVNKEPGTTENVYLQNTDTMAEINLGRITPGLLRILTKDGYVFEDVTGSTEDDIKCKDKWTLKVSDEVKDELRKLAMPMKKPIRNKSKSKENKPKKEKEIVDVLDIIYGLNK